MVVIYRRSLARVVLVVGVATSLGLIAHDIYACADDHCCCSSVATNGLNGNNGINGANGLNGAPGLPGPAGQDAPPAPPWKVIVPPLISGGLSILTAAVLWIFSVGPVQAETFRQLRSQFAGVRRGLRDLGNWNLTTLTAVQCRAVEKYWYHSFDEWYITQKLSRLPLKRLWGNYYAEAIRVASTNHIILVGLAYLDRKQNLLSVAVDKEFVEIVRQMAGESRWADALRDVNHWVV